MDVVSELVYWCSYGKCYIREQKDTRPRVDAVTATTSNRNRSAYANNPDADQLDIRPRQCPDSDSRPGKPEISRGTDTCGQL
jgi:hypothetical protein